MDIQVFSFVLAIVVGLLCFALVKRTADEFDRWYDKAGLLARLQVPATVGVITTFALAAVFLLVH
jgi:hypothetical protein